MADKLTYGSYYFDIAAETTLSALTPAKAAGATVLMQAYGFTVATDNRITLSPGQATRKYEVTMAMSVTKASGGSTVGQWLIYKNGIAVPGLHITRQLDNTSDIGSVTINGQVELEAEDYLELWVQTTNGDNITIEEGILAVKVIG